MGKKPYSQRSDLEKIQSNWTKTLGLFSRREYSLSIVRAAVTAELCLNFVIRMELHNKRNLPYDFVDNLLKWANGISGKIDKLYLPILKDSDFHSEAKEISKKIKAINTERNAVAHRGEFRKKETAEKFISQAREELLKLIRHYEPKFELKPFDPKATHSMSMIVPGGGIVQTPLHPAQDED